MTRITTSLSVVAVAAALALSGCAAEPDAGASPSPSATPAATAPTTAAPTAEPSAPSAERPTVDSISCDSMLDPEVDRQLRTADLIPFDKPWTQFDFTPTGAAIECPWGVEGSMESSKYFAWAALAEGEGAQFLALTAENGYTTTEDERGTWVVSTDPLPGDSAILVTDEWIAYAPTPDDISAILWTR
ncbi:hypothetical protein [Microbacterium phyllosphaerae]|uniref:hypothetical protein n=1 Tax=Microbacterium phyllosphaerae TaxID=124798 RepID=UPI00216718B1|nr:hypothetical protein [Microbacterium phyllosphaerae]MCS3444678.1 hypothetical protein [Microbacterium phyllosphaerae]